MSVRAGQLVAPVQLGIADAVLYTCPSATGTVIKRAVFSNVTGSPVTITLNVVPSGASATTANQIINARSLAAYESWISPELAGLALGVGDTIHGLASSGSAVVVVMSGVQIT